MPIDVDRAVGAELPTFEVAWSDQDVLLYHLALGAGVPATDPRELAYAYEKGLKVLPTFAVVAGAGTSAGLSALPGIDVDLAAVLHGEQEVEVHRPIPVQAQGRTTARVADVYDKGKAAILILESRTQDTTGAPLFTTRASIFIRGEGGFGGHRGPQVRFDPPEREPDVTVDCPTLEQQALLYRLCGDRNPLHADPEFAALAGFDRPILHGLCSFGIVCKAAVDHCLDGEPARVRRYRARFAGVVFPGETIRVAAWKAADHLVLRARAVERDTIVLSDAALWW